jgi:hypothetical protein
MDLERCGLALSRWTCFATDGGRGLLKALQEEFSKNLARQRCVMYKSRNLQRDLAKLYRTEAQCTLTTVLEQTRNTEWDRYY